MGRLAAKIQRWLSFDMRNPFKDPIYLVLFGTAYIFEAAILA